MLSSAHHDHDAPHHDAGHAEGTFDPPGAGHDRPLLYAFGLTVAYLGVEIAAALWTGSLALLADAAHMASDSAGLAVALFAARVARRPRSAAKTYGYRRAEVLAALVNGIVVLGAAGWIANEAIARFRAPREVLASGMMATAVAGLVVNVVAAWILARHAHRSINVRGALLHVLGDALGSVAAISAAGVILATGWRMADSLASIAICVIIAAGAFRLLAETVHVLMEGTPTGIDVAVVERTITETPGVAAIHDLHAWAITPGEPMLTAHVVLEAGYHGTDVVARVCRRLHDVHRIEHSTIQPEAPASKLVQLRQKN